MIPIIILDGMFLVLGGLAGCAITMWRMQAPLPPCCLYCHSPLRRVDVFDVERPLPRGAVWYCPKSLDLPATHYGSKVRYFGDAAPPAKPAADEEL